MDQIRSFIAIELPESVKTGLKQVQDYLRSNDPTGAKWVDPESIHLTLKFLGNVDADKVEAVTQAIQSASKNIGPFHLELKGLGAFPSLRRVQVVWVGITGDLDELLALQKQIEFYVSPLGFPTEKRGFTPHLTLARVRDMATPQDRQSLSELISRTEIGSNLTIHVSSVNLMRSQLTRAGAIYSRLSSTQLSPSCQ